MHSVIALLYRLYSHDHREALRTVLILSPVLGLCWLLGLFIFGDNLTYIAVIEWIFFVVVTAQGVIIFGLHCVINKEVLYTSPVLQSLFIVLELWMDITAIVLKLSDAHIV